MNASPDELMRLPVYRALMRPDSMLGCERELFLAVGLLTVVLIVVAMDLIAAVAGVCLWGGSVFGLRAMAKVDPVLSKVYVRHIKYRNFYPAHATPFRPVRGTEDAENNALARAETIPQPVARLPRSVELGTLVDDGIVLNKAMR